ncbi:hypothetical protein TSAR_001639 [Trichomalopsis sarcophagae]|uniref:Uncharacterized protein n=1 Tax=Trichomalopsis sarcophagae TaxID=543379 RepID=A0A232EYM8_9HYME|nr:hypothetical protein TSAR_001639 [Trichomalopsis sarcophagae]
MENQASMKMSEDMFEGKDYPTQWALNPAAYQNMNSDQVDWAALAQQWIKMKETSIPPAPPPPSIADELQCLSSNNGGGEAPMDMDTKDDDIPPAPPAPNISGTDDWNQWNQWGSHWNQNSATSGNWEWNNSIPPGLDGKSVGISNVSNNVIIPPPAPTISSTSPPFPNHCSQSTAVQPAAPPIPPSFRYSTMPLSQSQFSNQVSSNTFWNNEHQHPVTPGTTVPIQSNPFIKGLRQNSNRIPLVPPPASTLATPEMITSRNREIRDRTPEDDFASTLDTVKRRQLPAWIREGLEKMEREKQKAVERERQEILRKQELEALKEIEDQARAVLNPSRSKFDSDSEKETTEHEYDDDNKVSSNSNEEKQSPKDNSKQQHSPDLMRPRKTRFRDAASPVVHTRTVVTTHKEKSPDNTSMSVALRQNKEEMLQNLMLKVRRSLTEILLEVTNDEISSVCKEVWRRHCSKAPTGHGSITASHTAAPVSQITRKLGLGIYGDSNSESEDEHVSNHEHSQQSPGDNDSEEELKETLKRRQQAFRRTEAEIEARLAEEEEEDEEDEDRVKVKRSGEQEETENLRKRIEGSSRDDQSSREKDVRNEVRGMERRLRKDSGMGNTSGFKIVDSEIDTSSKSTVADSARLAEGNVSSSSESADHYSSSKRTARSSKSKSSKSSSRKKLSRYGENAKDGSSSRSRSRSKNKYSSREGLVQMFLGLTAGMLVAIVIVPRTSESKIIRIKAPKSNILNQNLDQALDLTITAQNLDRNLIQDLLQDLDQIEQNDRGRVQVLAEDAVVVLVKDLALTHEHEHELVLDRVQVIGLDLVGVRDLLIVTKVQVRVKSETHVLVLSNVQDAQDQIPEVQRAIIIAIAIIIVKIEMVRSRRIATRTECIFFQLQRLYGFMNNM